MKAILVQLVLRQDDDPAMHEEYKRTFKLGSVLDLNISSDGRFYKFFYRNRRWTFYPEELKLLE